MVQAAVCTTFFFAACTKFFFRKKDKLEAPLDGLPQLLSEGGGMREKETLCPGRDRREEEEAGKGGPEPRNRKESMW